MLKLSFVLDEGARSGTLSGADAAGVEVWREKVGAAELDAIIAALISMRMAMQPAISTEPPAIEPGMVGVSDPRLGIAHIPETGDRYVILRHPGAGWLLFSVPPESAARLAKRLTTAPVTTGSSSWH